MARNKVQPYIEPTTELVDVLGMGAGTAVQKRGVKVSKRGSKYGSVKAPKRSWGVGVEM